MHAVHLQLQGVHRNPFFFLSFSPRGASRRRPFNDIPPNFTRSFTCFASLVHKLRTCYIFSLFLSSSLVLFIVPAFSFLPRLYDLRYRVTLRRSTSQSDISILKLHLNDAIPCVSLIAPSSYPLSTVCLRFFSIFHFISRCARSPPPPIFSLRAGVGS